MVAHEVVARNSHHPQPWRSLHGTDKVLHGCSVIVWGDDRGI